jgi:uncharacterized membrane protein YqiK
MVGAIIGIVLVVILAFLLPSFRRIGPTQVGLVTKRFSLKKLSEDNPVAFQGEARYQAELLMAGLRWKFWVIYKVDKFPWVQVPAGEIGVVIAQVGTPLPIGAKSRYSRTSSVTSPISRRSWATGGRKASSARYCRPGQARPSTL